MFIEDYKKISRLKLTISVLEDILLRYHHLFDDKNTQTLQNRLKFLRKELKIHKALTEN